MKKYIFICFLLHNIAFGQYQSLFSDSSTTWSIMENRSNLDDPQYPIYNLSIDHDTIDVNGDTIYYIIGTPTSIGYGYFLPNENFYAKEDVTQGKAWFKKNYTDTTWYKIFDLSLNVGDILGSLDTYNLPQAPVDSVYFDAQNRKHIRFNQNTLYSGKYEFIEGVGSSFGLVRTVIYHPGKKPTLVCQHKNGILNYGLTFQLDVSIIPSTTILFFDNCEFTLNTDELSESFFQLSPNPASEALTVTIPDGEVLEGVKIYNAMGQEVFAQKATNQVITVSQLESGFYTIELAINDKRYAKRFIKL